MKVHRIRLRNFRGVLDFEVQPRAPGVTVIEGPNEAGKSSLNEALDLLLEEYDSTTKAAVKAIKPVDRDSGPEVEAEIETGPYRFVYFKRFLAGRHNETRLRVLAPKPENLTGRDAHDRVRQILEETLDLALWKALRIQQGDGLGLPSLDGQKALSAALDRAAGTVPMGEREVAVFQAVEAEYRRYWHARGETREVKDARESVAGAQARLLELEGRHRSLDSDVARSAELIGLVQAANEAQARDTKRAAELQEQQQAVEKMRETVGKAKAEWESADLKFKAAAKHVADRRDLAKRTDDLAREVGRLHAISSESQKRLKEEQAALDEAQRAYDDARAVEQTARAIAARRNEDAVFLHDLLDLQMMRERRDRLVEARQEAEEARAVLAVNSVTEEVLEGLREASKQAAVARSRLEAAGGIIELKAFAPLETLVAGRPRSLSAGQELREPLVQRFELALPGVLDLRVEPGTGGGNLRARAEAADEDLRRGLEAVGVGSIEEAVRVRQQRFLAEQAQATYEEVRKRELRDLRDLEDLEERIGGLEKRTSLYRADRPPEPSLPANYDEADALRQAAGVEVSQASKKMEEAAQKRDQRDKKMQRLRDQFSGDQATLKLQDSQADALSEQLRAARHEVADDALAKASEEAQAKMGKLFSVFQAEEQKLQNADPDSLETRFETARATLQAADRNLEALKTEQTGLASRLETLQEQGLFDLMEAERGTLAQAQRHLDGLARRAGAARLLYDTMDSARTSARQAYLKPLKERVEHLGRVVYGAGFQVELDEDLAIATRTLNDITLPYESLSAGAKEQMGVLLRLACALTVADEGGVPVVFDDTLGYTDPPRLEAMGAVLRLAGKECQVLLMTCVPDRYRYVGEAHVVRMRQ